MTKVVKDPPFQVSESGYGSFNLPVEVYFRNKDEPKKVKFDYDLLLPNLNDPPINQIRSECLTFQNPSEEFRQKLLKAGGVVSNGPPVPVGDKPKTPLPTPAVPALSNNSAPIAASIANNTAPPPNLPPPASKLKRSGSSLEGESAPKKKKKTEGKMKEKKKRTNSSSSESSESDSSSEASNSGNEEEAAMVTKLPKNAKKSSPNNWDTPSLKRLHKQLNSLQDPQQLQEIVNIIEQTGLYNLTASTFDFDLCKLDDQTLSKLSKFVEPSPSSTSSF